MSIENQYSEFFLLNKGYNFNPHTKKSIHFTIHSSTVSIRRINDWLEYNDRIGGNWKFFENCFCSPTVFFVHQIFKSSKMMRVFLVILCWTGCMFRYIFLAFNWFGIQKSTTKQHQPPQSLNKHSIPNFDGTSI